MNNENTAGSLSSLALAGGALAAASMISASSNPSSSVSGPSGPSKAAGDVGSSTSFGEGNTPYDNGLPCRNPSCKSYGISHPNCRCYPGMAEGGEVSSFCSESRKHLADCEYYAIGGEVYSDDDVDTVEEEFPDHEINEIYDPKEIKVTEPDPKKHSGIASKILAGGEALAKGFGDPLTTALETGLGEVGKLAPLTGYEVFSKENQNKRKEENPGLYAGMNVAGTIGGLVSPAGVPRALGKVGTKIAKMAPESIKWAQNAISQGIQAGLITTSDEISKTILGVGNDIETAAKYITSATALGLLVGTGAEVASKAIEPFNKIGSKAYAFLEGFGSKSPKVSTKGVKDSMLLRSFNAGVAAREKYAIPLTTTIIGAAEGARQGDGFMDRFEKATIGGLIGTGAGSFFQVMGPIALKMALTKGGQFSADAMDQLVGYFNRAEKGQKNLSKWINTLFQSGVPQLKENEEKRVKSAKKLSLRREKLKEKIKNGGYEQNIKEMMASKEPLKFANGGIVTPQNATEAIEQYYPQENMIINESRMRITNYLSSLQPQTMDVTKAAFDTYRPDPVVEKDYDRAIDIANNPLMVLQEVEKGTLKASDVVHFQTMFPEVNDLVQNELSKKISEAQMHKKKPTYKIRQGLSMLMGVPLSSDFKQQNIAAVQQIYAQQKQAKQQAAAKSPLSKAPIQFNTQLDARARRGQKQ